MGDYDLTLGAPSAADSVSFLAARGIELVVEYDPNHYENIKKTVWGHVAAVDWATALRVYLPSATTFNVAAGEYMYKGELKTYSPSTAVDPTDNDTTYVWLKPDNTIDSGIDGSGWPATEHIPLAEIDVDSDGVITAVRDLRGRSFMEYNGVGTTRVFTAALTAGSTVQIHNANAPFKYRVLDAWSVARSTDAGTWKLTDGTNDITDAVAVTATDKTIDRVGTIDDAYHEIAAATVQRNYLSGQALKRRTGTLAREVDSWMPGKLEAVVGVPADSPRSPSSSTSPSGPAGRATMI